MKKGQGLLLALALGAHGAMASTAFNFDNSARAVPGEYVVKFSPSQSSGLMRAFAARGLQLADTVNKEEGLYLMRAQAGRTAEATASAVALLAHQPGVEIVEPNYTYHAMTEIPAPNDTHFAKQWGLKNVGKVGADIHALEGWAAGMGSERVVVAITDTGIDYRHPDLRDNMWTKPGTTDVHGINTITGKEDPLDDAYVTHGTHCAGIIGAVGGNNQGIVGVNWRVALMGAKFLNSQGGGDLANAIKAIDWAVEHGAQVISASWGGGPSSRLLEDSIRRAGQRGIVFVAAAGNEANNNDARPTYPASYNLDNIIAVAATDSNDRLADFSNFGATKVLLAAPGVEIYSTLKSNSYGNLDGTSMAAPHVTGAVALLLAREPNLSPTEVRARIAKAVDKVAGLAGKVATGGRLNIAKLFLPTEN